MEGNLNQMLLMWGIVIFFSVFLKKLSVRMGLPMLLAFLFLGIVFGSDGVFKIPFENYSLQLRFDIHYVLRRFWNQLERGKACFQGSGSLIHFGRSTNGGGCRAFLYVSV
mgnify:CR=1 FL=1